MGQQGKFYQPSIKVGPDQQAALNLSRSNDHKFHLFYGGGGSGKSFLIQYVILGRAQNAPGSRHGVFRLTRQSCERTLFNKTLFEVMDTVFPGLREQCRISYSDMTVELPNGSVISYDGLDENRITKVLGDEFNTIWLNECNEFTYKHVSTLLGRLRYQANKLSDGLPLKNKMFFDCNPRSKKDWDYLAFVAKVNPADGAALTNASEWVSCKLSPQNNVEHLGDDYIATMESTMSAADRKRYVEGEWANDNPDALFKEPMFNDHRIPIADGLSPEQILATLPPLKRIVVGVDPAVSKTKDSDLTGINVSAVGYNGRGYVLEDASGKYSPDQWANRVAALYRKWGADRIVAEKNQGGDMVEHTLRTAHPNLPIKLVHATRGKTVRAEPVSALYEQGKVHHVGKLIELEEQLCDYPLSTGSPDRMDALVWALTEVMDIGGDGPRPGVTMGKGSGRTR